MGFSVAAVYAVVFAATLFFIYLLFPSVNNFITDISDGINTKYDATNGLLDTDLSVYSVSYNKTSNELTLSILNDGETVLNPHKTELIIDGERVTTNISSITVEGRTTDIWLHGEVMTVTVNITGIGLDYTNITARHYAANANNLTSPGALSVYDRIYLIDSNDHIDVFDRDGTFKYTIKYAGITPTDLSVTDGKIYYINNNQSVYAENLDGTNNTELISNAELSNPTSIFAKDYLYVVNAQSDIYRFNLDGSGKALLTSFGAPHDIYVTDYIYVINGTGGSADLVRFTLDGGNETTLIPSPNFLAPTTLAISDEDFASGKGKIYVADGSRIDVFELDGTSYASFDEKLSNSVFGVDVSDRIFVSDQVNDLNIFRLGSSAKVVMENGKTLTITI